MRLPEALFQQTFVPESIQLPRPSPQKILPQTNTDIMKPYFLTVLLTLTVMITLKAREASLSEGTGRAKFLAGMDKGSKFGIKAGYNAARITGQTSNYKPRAEGVYSTAAFFAPRSHSGFGYRSE